MKDWNGLPERPGDKHLSVAAKEPLEGVAHAIAGMDTTSCGALEPYWEHRLVDLDVARRMHRPCQRCDWAGYNDPNYGNDRIEATCDPRDGVRHAIDPTRCPGDCRRCTGCARCRAPAT